VRGLSRPIRSRSNGWSVATGLLLILIVGCSNNSGSGSFAVEEEAPSREFYETRGPLAFSQQALQITNTSGKGEAFISGRSYVPDDAGLYPLLVFLPGFGATFEFYAEYAEHFASHGIVVVSISFSGNGGFNLDGENDLLLIQVADALGFSLEEYAAKIDDSKIAVMGHSQGGKMAFYAAAAFNGSDPSEPFVGMAIGLDPVNSGGAPCFVAPNHCTKYPVAPNPHNGDIGQLDNLNGASLILRSEPDPLTNPEAQFNSELFYRGFDGDFLYAAPSPVLYVDMGSASHASYAQPADEDNPVPVIAKRTAIAWLKKHFEGAQNLQAFFTGEHMQADIDAGLVVAAEER
jgi:dienelactone hydrolase